MGPGGACSYSEQLKQTAEISTRRKKSLSTLDFLTACGRSWIGLKWATLYRRSNRSAICDMVTMFGRPRSKAAQDARTQWNELLPINRTRYHLEIFVPPRDFSSLGSGKFLPFVPISEFIHAWWMSSMLLPLGLQHTSHVWFWNMFG